MRVGLNLAESQDIYNELNTNGFLDANGFLNASPSEIQAHIQNNQSDWPNFVVLPNQQKRTILPENILRFNYQQRIMK